MDLTSKLDSVTVYARGALCLRRASLKADGRQVRLIELPLSLHPGSLRARIEKGPDGLKVLDVRAGYDAKLPEQVNVPVEHQALDVAEEALLRLQQDWARLDREIRELQSVSPVFPQARPGEPPRVAPISALLQASDFVDAQLKRRFEMRRVLHQSVEDATHEVELRRRRIAEASSALRGDRVQLHRTAVVTLSEQPLAEGAELCLEYFVPGARWAPSYDLRLARGLGSGTLTMRAAVAQCTGEDWSGVTLGLSTASLDRRTELPVLRALKIGRAQPPPPRSGWRDPPAGLDALFEGFDGAWQQARNEPAPPVPPAPMAGGMDQALPVKERAAKKAAARRDEPMPTPPAQMERLAAQMHAAPSAPSRRPASSVAPPMAAPSVRPPAPASPKLSLGRARMASRGGPGSGGGSYEVDEAPSAPEMSMDEELSMADGAAFGEGFGDDEPSGTFTLSASPGDAGVEPGAALLDYGRLEMPGASDGGRGRLRAAPENPFAFFAAASVQINVLVGLVTKAQQLAAGVELQPLPRGAVAPSAGSFDYRYDCSHRVDVPSTSEWTVVSVMAADVGLTAEYSCVPSVETNVYRTVKLHNRSSHALLQGPVDVSVGDEFLLTAELPLVAPGSSDARLGLGVEEAIKVSRKTQFKETTGGLLGGSTVLPHEIEIEVNNRLPTPAQIEVRERVPVTQENDVKIEESQVKPPWEKDEQLRDGVVTFGARAWRLTVPAGQKVSLSAQYVIRIPSDKMVVGGNRRV